MATKRLYCFLGLAILFFAPCSNQLSAQLTLNSVGFRLGTIEALSTDKIVFYPEIQTGGQCFLQYLEWTAFIAYWDDAATPAYLSEHAFYSTKGSIMGGRIAFDPSKADEHWVLPIDLFVGFAHQFISPTYADGPSEPTGSEYMGPTGINSFEIGISAYASIFDTIELSAQIQQLFAISEVSKRLSYSVGFNYVF